MIRIFVALAVVAFVVAWSQLTEREPVDPRYDPGLDRSQHGALLEKQLAARVRIRPQKTRAAAAEQLGVRFADGLDLSDVPSSDHAMIRLDEELSLRTALLFLKAEPMICYSDGERVVLERDPTEPIDQVAEEPELLDLELRSGVEEQRH